MWARNPEQVLFYRRLREIVVLFALLVGPGLAAPSSLAAISTSIRPLIAIITRNLAFVMLILYLADIQGESMGNEHVESTRGLHRRVISGVAVFLVLGLTSLFIGLIGVLSGADVATVETSGTGQILPQLVTRYPAAIWVPILVGAMISVGYVEELFFRSYLLKRLIQLGLSPRMTIFTAALLFSVGHGYQGTMATLFALVAGIVLGILWRRWSDIHAFAIGHATYNLVAIVLSAA